VADAVERVIWTGRPSWRGRISIIAPGLLLAVVVLVLALWLGLDVLYSIALGLAIAAVAVVWGLLETIRWKYTVTEHRVFVRHGLLSVTEQTARLERVQDLTLRQSILERVLGVGSLDIDTAGSEGGPLVFRALQDPAAVREVLDTAVQRERHAEV
jgi:membrane protein YdbS with pleckstrin-like domain